MDENVTFVVDRGNSTILFLARTVPKLVSHRQIINNPVMKTKIIPNGGDCVLEKRMTSQSFDNWGFSSHTRPNKTNFNIFINFLDVFLNYLHQWIVKRLVFAWIDRLITNSALCRIPQTAQANGVTAWDDVWTSLCYAVTQITWGTLHMDWTKL